MYRITISIAPLSAALIIFDDSVETDSTGEKELFFPEFSQNDPYFFFIFF